MPTNIQTVTQNLRHYQSIHSEHAYIFLFILYEWMGVPIDQFCW